MPRILDIAYPYQHPGEQPIAWPAVKASDVVGVIVKATEGQHYINPWLVRDVKQAHLAGLRVGAYHFAQPNTNPPAVEAEWFLAQIAGLPLDLPHHLDLETGQELGWQQLADWAEEWFLHVADFVGPNAVFLDGDYLRNLPLAPWGKRLSFMTPDEPAPVGTWMQRQAGTQVTGVPAATDINVLVGELPDTVTEPPVPLPAPTPIPVPPVPPAPIPEGECTVNVPILKAQTPPYSDLGYVSTVQSILNVKAGVGPSPDGKFGPQTEAHVKAFQEAHGLTVDGIVGPITWDALCKS